MTLAPSASLSGALDGHTLQCAASGCATPEHGERQTQLETLGRCLREARAGCGKLVLIAAEAGLGKSVLVERFAAEHRRDARTLRGRHVGTGARQHRGA